MRVLLGFIHRLDIQPFERRDPAGTVSSKDAVAEVMSLHRCAVALDAELQASTNRLLTRDALTMGEKLAVKRVLLSKYLAAKPEIDACNARFNNDNTGDDAVEDEFYMGESDWEGGPVELLVSNTEWDRK